MRFLSSIAIFSSIVSSVPLRMSRSTGISISSDANFHISIIPQGFIPLPLTCMEHQLNMNSNSSVTTFAAIDMTYDSAISLLTGFSNGLYVNRPLGPGEHLDISSQAEQGTTDGCEDFIEQFVQGDGADGCLLFAAEAACVHFWLEAPVG